jgi:hypothetical protein
MQVDQYFNPAEWPPSRAHCVTLSECHRVAVSTTAERVRRVNDLTSTSPHYIPEITPVLILLPDR